VVSRGSAGLEQERFTRVELLVPESVFYSFPIPIKWSLFRRYYIYLLGN
jgi:hypothetical protein